MANPYHMTLSGVIQDVKATSGVKSTPKKDFEIHNISRLLYSNDTALKMTTSCNNTMETKCFNVAIGSTTSSVWTLQNYTRIGLLIYLV
jgi:hypothetical protein